MKIQKYMIFILLLAFFIGIPTSAIGADELSRAYSPYFFGLSTELTALPGGPDEALAGLGVESLCWTASVGHRDLFPYPKIRARGGLGFWPGRYFVTKLGLEVPVFEVLNPMKARMVGLYAYVDGVMRIGASGVDLSLNPSARFLVPISPVGGLAFGVGYDTTYGMTLHVDYLAGFYALM